jgi:hypothetical protein
MAIEQFIKLNRHGMRSSRLPNSPVIMLDMAPIFYIASKWDTKHDFDPQLDINRVWCCVVVHHTRSASINICVQEICCPMKVFTIFFMFFSVLVE